jgi:hypothetical protein
LYETGVWDLAEPGVCGELEKDEQELVQGCDAWSQAVAEEREVGIVIFDDMVGGW